MAFESKLTSTCFKRVRSAPTKQGTAKRGNVNVTLRFCAWGSIIAWHSFKISPNDTGSNDNANRPDSTCAKSSTSLIKSSKYQPA